MGFKIFYRENEIWVTGTGNQKQLRVMGRRLKSRLEMRSGRSLRLEIVIAEAKLVGIFFSYESLSRATVEIIC